MNKDKTCYDPNAKPVETKPYDWREVVPGKIWRKQLSGDINDVLEVFRVSGGTCVGFHREQMVGKWGAPQEAMAVLEKKE